jgi:hypothetical protein
MYPLSALGKTIDILQHIDTITRIRAEMAQLENEAALLISRGQRVKAEEMFNPKHDLLNKELIATIKKITITGLKN